MARPSIGDTPAAPAADIARESRGPRASQVGTPLRDPVIAEVATWMAAKNAVEALQEVWSDLEHQLSLKMSPHALYRLEADRSNLPEARAMQALIRKMRAADRKLENKAEEIALVRVQSVAGALAQIELGLRIQGPYNWESSALALVRGGFAQLRDLV